CHEMPALGTARASAGVGAVALNDATRAVIYAAGGTSDLATGLATYEYLVVGADGRAFAANVWLAGVANNLPAARYEMQLFVATAENATRAGSDAWVYAGGGRGGLRALSAAKVDQTTGNLGAWVNNVPQMQSDRAGYA